MLAENANNDHSGNISFQVVAFSLLLFDDLGLPVCKILGTVEGLHRGTHR